MNYMVDFGSFVNGEWSSSISLPFEDDFEVAKDYMIRSAEVLAGAFEFATSDGEYVCIRMVENSDTKKPVRVIHYVTPHHPNVSLPSVR